MSANAKPQEVPSHGWEIRPLGEVVRPTRPRIKPSEKPDLPFIGMEHIEAHTMKLLGTVPASTMKSSAVHFQPGDVLYGRLRPYLNKVYRPDFEGLCSAEFIVFPKTDGVESRYLQYFINSSTFASFASHLNTGDRPRVDFDQLAPYPFPVAPLDQQKHIVAEIEKQFSRLDEAVANLKRVKANLKRYKAAVLKAAVEGGFSGGTNGWSEMGLEELIGDDSVFVDGDWVESKDQDPEGDVRLVQLADIGDGVYRDRSSRFLTSKKAERLRCTFLELGDVMVARMPDPLGRACIFPGDAKKCVTVVDVCVIRPGLERIDRRWLMHTLNAPTNRAQIAALQAGSTRKRISRKNLATIQIHVPSYAVQAKVAQEVDRRFSIMEQLDTQIDANLQRAERLRQSVLKTAFSAKLVVHHE